VKPTFILLLLLFINVLFISLNLTRKVNSFKYLVYYVFSPFNDKIFNFINQTKELDNRVVSLIRVDKENKKLKQQINELLFFKNRYEQLLRESKYLYNTLKLYQEINFEIISARIISQDPSNWFRTIMIDKGKKDGIIQDMCVISFISDKVVLVGRVCEVNQNSSKVILITDKLSFVPAEILSSRYEGLITGSDSSYLILDYILPDISLKIGDEIITSGIGEIYPSGIYIGIVKEIEDTKKTTYFKHAIVEPYAKLNFLKEVFLLKK